MNIRDLQYLVALADTGHFGKAAEQCFVSQPTLSTQLKKLEDFLGVALVERTNKSVLITPVGEQVVAEARLILTQVEKIKTLARQSSEPLAGPFRLGIIPTLGPYLLPFVIKLIQKNLPKIELVVIENKTKTILQQLRDGQLDAVILALPVNTDQLQVVELFNEPFYVAIPKAHELAKAKDVTMKRLEKENLLLLEEGHCLREQALEACQLRMPHQHLQFSATSLETLRQLVGLGSGITFLPALAIESASKDSNIVIKPISGKAPARSIGMLWRKSSVLTECSFKIAELVSAAIKQVPQVTQIKNSKVLSALLE